MFRGRKRKYVSSSHYGRSTARRYGGAYSRAVSVIPRPVLPYYSRRQRFSRGSTLKSGVPESATVNLVTFLRHTDATAATSVDLVLYPNSANDPFGAVSAEQPSSFDQWATMYQYYKVLYTTMDLEVVNRVADNITICCVNHTSATAFTSIGAAGSQPGAVAKTVSPSGGPNNKIYIKGFAHNPCVVLGKYLYYDQNTVATTSANPSSLSYLHIYMQSHTVNLSGIVLNIRLTQRTKFFAKKQLIDA